MATLIGAFLVLLVFMVGFVFGVVFSEPSDYEDAEESDDELGYRIGWDRVIRLALFIAGAWVSFSVIRAVITALV